MKKATLTLMAFALFSIATFSQTKKMVLVEQFTNASCAPCAAYNPILEAIIDDPQNSDDVLSIKYQWYFPGYDPMHNHNVPESLARTSSYGINGVPTSVVGGNSWQGNTGNITQTEFDNLKGNTSPFEIKLSHKYDDNLDKIEVRMVIKATATTTANMRAHIVVVEEHIGFANPPGSNGEKDFFNVMKKMLPNNNGTSLPGTINIGDSVVITESWKMKNIYDYDEVAVTAFVQNVSNKQVYQAAHSSPIPFTPVHSLNVQAISISELPIETCLDEVTPDFTLRNGGATTITSADFEYSMNGGTKKTFNWTGNLDFNESETVSLGDILFTNQTINTIEIYPTSVNTSTDDYSIGDTITSSFNATEKFNAFLNFKTVIYSGGEATKWQLLSSDGSVYAESKPYTDAGTFEEQVGIKVEDCYRLEFTQNGGIGDFKGVFTVEDGDENMVTFSLASYDTYLVKEFTVNALTLDVEESLENNILTVYPNPSNGEINIKSSTTTNANVLDITGKTVQNISLKAGKNSTINLNPGVYFIKINTIVEKVIVN